MTNRKAINKYSGQMMNALISAGFYDVRIQSHDDHTRIDVSEYPTIRFTEIKVYEDGIAHCYEGKDLSFELRVSDKKSIMNALTK